MTITVNQTNEIVSINNTAIPATFNFVLTSGYSRVPQVLPGIRLEQNTRYSEIEITFPADFKDEHRNGVYYYSIEAEGVSYERGYVKIVTDPGGSNGAVPFIANPETENRESKVFYRPEY
jgi:hypothetical protein|tara:strand:- start:121 stop:480 length:360 start_codon:yes stop_codon:yes gene_type:complete